MTTDTATRPASGIARILGMVRKTESAPSGPAPTWVDDPEMGTRLSRDVGLSPEMLGGKSARDPKLPFFMQHGGW
jgi:hypothetical protein